MVYIYLFSEIKLGLTISGEEVRLITNKDDPYQWSRLPGTEHLFSKQLSKHCLRSYREIYEGVGRSFEAVPNHSREFFSPPERGLHDKRLASDFEDGSEKKVSLEYPEENLN